MILQLTDLLQVVQLEDVFAERDADTVYLVMPLLQTDLSGLIAKRPQLQQETTENICRQILSGLHYMHQLGVIHGDLKPANILLTSSWQVKVIVI